MSMPMWQSAASTGKNRSNGTDAESVRGGRPLYLMTRKKCTVKLDGPSLVIGVESKMRSRYPLNRISRVVSSQNVEWKPQAISACLTSGIPIVLLNQSGIPVGYIQPMVPSVSTLDTLLREFVGLHNWREILDIWVRAERMRAVRTTLQKRQLNGRPVDDDIRCEWVRRFVYGERKISALDGYAGIYQAALMALVCQKLRKAGIAFIYHAEDGTEFHVATELCSLFEVSLALELQGLGSQLNPQTRECLRIIDAYMDEFEDVCAQMLGRLCCRTRRLLSEWH